MSHAEGFLQNMWFSKKKTKGKKKPGKSRLDVRARRRVLWYHRLSVVGRFLSLVFCVAVLLFAGWKAVRSGVDAFLLENDAFALRRFKLETNGRLEAKQVLHWAGVRSGDNVLDLDLAEIKRNLELVPMIHDVSVERVLPDRLTVRIRERRPIFKAYFLSPGRGGEGIQMKPFMIDEYGYVLTSQAVTAGDLDHAEYWLKLPELTGITGLGLVPGQSSNSLGIKQAITTYQAFQASSLNERVKIRSIDVSMEDTLVLTTSEQQEVTLGNYDLMLQFRRWERMLDEASRNEMRLVTLDLSTKNNHPFRWVQRSMAAPRTERDSEFARRIEL